MSNDVHNLIAENGTVKKCVIKFKEKENEEEETFRPGAFSFCIWILNLVISPVKKVMRSEQKWPTTTWYLELPDKEAGGKHGFNDQPLSLTCQQMYE